MSSSISTGHYHSMALRTNGTVWSWGWNHFGQLGDGTTTSRRVPVRVENLTGVIQIAGARDHALALKSDGTVWAWGDNEFGNRDRLPHAEQRAGAGERPHERGCHRRRPRPLACGQEQRQRVGLGLEPLRPARRRHDDEPGDAGARRPARDAEDRRGHRGRRPQRGAERGRSRLGVGAELVRAGRRRDGRRTPHPRPAGLHRGHRRDRDRAPAHARRRIRRRRWAWGDNDFGQLGTGRRPTAGRPFGSPTSRPARRLRAGATTASRSSGRGIRSRRWPSACSCRRRCSSCTCGTRPSGTGARWRSWWACRRRCPRSSGSGHRRSAIRA